MEQALSERRTYRYEDVTSNPDLDERARDHVDTDEPGGSSYRITIYDADGIVAEAEPAYAVYYEDIGRLGIAWGAGATWADVSDLESGIDMWLNDGEEWERRN